MEKTLKILQDVVAPNAHLVQDVVEINGQQIARETAFDLHRDAQRRKAKLPMERSNIAMEHPPFKR